MHCGRVFFTQSSRGELRFECGASWEVDLRSDADCASSSLGRCHPRYTLGSAAREVSLFRGERQLPHRAEYAHAFCDAWGSRHLQLHQWLPEYFLVLHMRLLQPRWQQPLRH